MAKGAKKGRAATTERNILADEELEWVGLGHWGPKPTDRRSL